MRIICLLVVLLSLTSPVFAATTLSTAVGDISNKVEDIAQKIGEVRTDLASLKARGISVSQVYDSKNKQGSLYELIVILNEFRKILKETLDIITDKSLKDTFREIDWWKLKTHHEEIKLASKKILNRIGDIKDLVKEAKAVHAELGEANAELVALISDLVDLEERDLVNIALNHAKEKIEGAEFAEEVAEKFKIPKVKVLDLRFSEPKDVYLEDTQGNRYVVLDDDLVKHTAGQYTGIADISFEVENFEMKYGELVFEGRAGSKQTLTFADLQFKRYFFIKDLIPVFEKEVVPATTIEILTRSYETVPTLLAHCAIDLQKEIYALKDLGTVREDPEQLTKYLNEQFEGHKFYLTKDPFSSNILYTLDKKPRKHLSFLKEKKKSDFHFVNLFEPELLAAKYETARIANGQYEINDIESSKIKTYGPSPKLSATIEAVKNTGDEPDIAESSSNTTGELKLKFDYTLVNRFKAKGWWRPIWFRYAKFGYNLNYKGHLDKVGTETEEEAEKANTEEKKVEDENTEEPSVEERLLNLYSDDAQNLFYFRLPLLTLSQKPRQSNVLDIGVIDVQLYEEKFKLTKESEEAITSKKRSWGVKLTTFDLQNYGETNFRVQFGINARTNNYELNEAGDAIEENNDKPVFWFGEFFWGNLYPVFVTVGARKMVGELDGYVPNLNQPWNFIVANPFSSKTVVYFSVNYRINPLDVISMTKKILFN